MVGFAVLLLLIVGVTGAMAACDDSDKTTPEIREIRMVSDATDATNIDVVIEALEIVSVRQWYDLGKDEEKWGFSDFKVYEVMLQNTGKERIYFFPIVYTDTISSTNLKLRTMKPGEIGTISTSVQIKEEPKKIIVAIEDIDSYNDYDGLGYGNFKETQIFSLDTENLQPPEWLWEASIKSRIAEKLDESSKRLGLIESRIAEKMDESSKRLGLIKPRIDEKMKQLRWRLACSGHCNNHGIEEYYKDYPIKP